MSFNNTKTPSKPKTNKGRHFIVEEVNGKYILTEEQKKSFRKLYPIRTNREMMTLFGLSHSTLQRIRRELKLQKDMKVIRKKHAAMVKEICEANGYYDSLRGKKPSQAALDGFKRYCEENGHPSTKLSKREKRKKGRALAEARKKKRATDAIRLAWGLPQLTRENIPHFKYSKQQISCRYLGCKKYGYIMGDYREKFGERYTIYYDGDTKRSEIYERNAGKIGFVIKELKE